MNTFSRVAIAGLTMVAVSGAAQAQAQPKAPAGPAAPKAAAPTGAAPKAAAPKAAAPTGSAGAPAPKAAAPKAAAPKAAAGAPAPPKAPAKAPVMPPPPAELETMAKSLRGTWRCKGEEWDDQGGKAPMTAISSTKLDLDKWWIVERMDAKGRMPFKMVAHTTYDPRAKKWRRIAVMNGGGQMTGTSDGMKDGKMTWNLDLLSPMGAGMMRDHLDLSDPKAGLKASGEMSMDRGKTWLKVYEMTCRK